MGKIKLKDKVSNLNLDQFMQESKDNIRQALDTGDYKFLIERSGEDLYVNSSRDLSIGDFTEIMVNILMLSPKHLREDLLALVIYVTEMLQSDQDNRTLN